MLVQSTVCEVIVLNLRKNLELNSISGKHELSFDEVFSRFFILFENLSKTSVH